MKPDVMRFTPLAIIPLLFICLIFVAGPGLAQSPADMTLSRAETMPAWAVPVLRLVSATHVEPTTGVVISDSGLVLVPADFATIGDEIIVLDGGTDLIRNGRPAKITHRFRGEGLQVLTVTGLRRSGAGFSAASLKDGDTIRLSAFPPAENIAEGAAPLDISVTIASPGGSAQPVLAAPAMLPNVTGPLLDDCGNLAGYSTADGVQSMSGSEATAYHWKGTLKRLFAEIQLEPRIIDCQMSPESPAGVEEPAADPGTEETVPEPVDEAADEEPDAEAKDPEAAGEEAQPAPPGDPLSDPLSEQDEANEAAQKESEPEAGESTEDRGLEELEMLPPYEDELTADGEAEATESPSAEVPNPLAWLWLVAAVLLIGAGLVLHRYRGRKGDSTDAATQARPSGPDASVERETEADNTASSLDSRLVISGMTGDGTPVEADCRVSSHAINLVIGRSHADLIIDSPAVSRQHASLNGTAESLTLSDLGSSNGTSINGVPCLEGETMFVSQDDTLILGNVRINYEILLDSDSDRQGQE